MPSNSYQPTVQTDLAAAIAAGQTASAAIDLSGCTLCGVYVPAAFTGTTLAFQASPDGAAFSRVGDGSGNAYVQSLAPGDFVPVDTAVFAGVRFVKIVSNAAEAAARSLTLAVRPV